MSTKYWVILWSINGLKPREFIRYEKRLVDLNGVRERMEKIKQQNPNHSFFITME